MNDAGTVSVFGSLGVSPKAIFTQNVIIARIGDVIGGFTLLGFGGGPSINNSGVVAFEARANSTPDGQNSMFTQNGPTGLGCDFSESSTCRDFWR